MTNYLKVPGLGLDFRDAGSLLKSVIIDESSGLGPFTGSGLTPGEGTIVDPTTTAQFDILKTSGVSPEVFIRFRQTGFNNAWPHQDTPTSVGGIQCMTGSNGGLTLYGLSTADEAIRIEGVVTTQDSGVGDTSHAAILLQPAVGTLLDTADPLADASNLVAIMNNANNMVLIKGNGQINSKGSKFVFGQLANPTSEVANETLGQLLGSTLAVYSLATSRANVDGQNIATLSYDMTANTAGYQQRASIVAQSSGATANKRGARLLLYVSQDNVVGTVLGATLDTDLSFKVVGGFGCNAAAPQTAYVSGGAIAAYGAGANGYDTAAHAQEIHDMVVKLRAALVANGIMS